MELPFCIAQYFDTLRMFKELILGRTNGDLSIFGLWQQSNVIDTGHGGLKRQFG